MLGKAPAVRLSCTTQNKSQEEFKKGNEKKKKRKGKEADLTFRRFLLNNDILMRNSVIHNFEGAKTGSSFCEWCQQYLVLGGFLITCALVVWQLCTSQTSPKEKGSTSSWESKPLVHCQQGYLPPYSHKQKSICANAAGEANSQRCRFRTSQGFPTRCSAPIRR